MEKKALLHTNDDDDDDDSGFKEVELMDPVGADMDEVEQKINDLKVNDVNIQINALQWLMDFTNQGGAAISTAHKAGGLKDLIVLSESENNDMQRLASGIIFNLSENPEVRESMEKMQIHSIKLKPEFGRAKTLTDNDVKQLQSILRRDPIDGGSVVVAARNLKRDLKGTYKPPVLCDGYLKCMKDNMMWKDYYVILSGPVLLMYSDKNDNTPKRILSIGYCMTDELPGRDDLKGMEDEYVNTLEGQKSASSFLIFSQRGIVKFKTDHSEDLKMWIGCITQQLESVFDPEEMSQKELAAVKLHPLLLEQSYNTWRHCKQVTEKLNQSGLLTVISPIESPHKKKEGVLEMQDIDSAEEGKWDRYFFVVLRGSIYYYVSSKDDMPKGYISIRRLSIELVKEDLEQGRWIINIVTPLRIMRLKCKHRVALEEWIRCICKARSTGNLELRNLMDEINSVCGDGMSESKEEFKEPINSDGSQQLVVWATYESKKPHKFKVGKPGLACQVTIGRDRVNTITLDDSRVSRSHGRIDIDEDGVVTFVDLGSTRGSKVNGVQKTRCCLKVKDEIKIGSTILQLDLENPSGNGIVGRIRRSITGVLTGK